MNGEMYGHSVCVVFGGRRERRVMVSIVSTSLGHHSLINVNRQTIITNFVSRIRVPEIFYAPPPPENMYVFCYNSLIRNSGYRPSSKCTPRICMCMYVYNAEYLICLIPKNHVYLPRSRLKYFRLFE